MLPRSRSQFWGGLEKEDYFLALPRCATLGALENGQGWLKKKNKPFVGLGRDYPPGPARLGIYDQITSWGYFPLDLLQSPFSSIVFTTRNESTKIDTQMFIEALFIIIQIKTGNSPVFNRWAAKYTMVHPMEYYLEIKRNDY